ncbi:MAG: hypothetical protein HY326_02115 [Chloroflexi bacterium]|nr:hypothetical protein [Chloroflexota bacterium]
MKTHAFGSHTAEEKRRLSNLGHVVGGLVFASVSVLVLLEAVGIAAWGRTAWPILALAGGMLLLFAIYLSHPRSDWPAIWHDPQQRQHTLIAAAMTVGGAAELLRMSAPAWEYIWPAALLFIGSLFLTHAQHGTGAAVVRAVRQHRMLGTTLIVAGLFRGMNIGLEAGVFTLLWPIALLAAAVQFIVYREPEGAYEVESGHGEHRQ